MPAITCPKCRATNASDAKFCQECGEALPKPVTPPGGRQINVVDAEGGASAIGANAKAIKIEGGGTYVEKIVIIQQAEALAALQSQVPPKTAQPVAGPASRPPVEERPKPPDLAAIPAGHHWRAIGIEPISIPAGRFFYGLERCATAATESFRIARLPVTNAQYKAFTDATGYPPPHHWQAGAAPKGKADHPVVNVSWEDAQGFCRWAGVRLPTEVEWEKAARGADGRVYPWGDQWDQNRCNSAEAERHETCPAGRFTLGASPYGVLDMAGNVWEWCADWYDASQAQRALRGGSFYFSHHNQRCAWRYGHYPVSRSPDFGFRVIVPDV